MFADGQVQLGLLAPPMDLTLAALRELVRHQVLPTEVPLGVRVDMQGLGSFTAGPAAYVEAVQDKLLWLGDMHCKLAGEPTTLDLCRRAYEDSSA